MKTNLEQLTTDVIDEYTRSLKDGTILEYFKRIAMSKISLHKEVIRRAKAEARVSEIRNARDDLKQRFDDFLEVMEPDNDD